MGFFISLLEKNLLGEDDLSGFLLAVSLEDINVDARGYGFAPVVPQVPERPVARIAFLYLPHQLTLQIINPD